MKNKTLGIYVHIPFCESKCTYCDFASFVCEEKEKYFVFLKDEIEKSEHKGRAVDTIYIGGGTPSSVEPKYIIQILQTIKSNFQVSKNAEITIECNPNSATVEKLASYLNSGVNRISFGVQSLQDGVLKFAGRRHTAKEAIAAIENAKTVGFKNISADLIIGFPNQTKTSVCQDAKKLISLGITHISTYMLQVEEGTLLYKIVKENPSLLPNDDVCSEIFQELVSFLEQNAFCQYEVSNFSKPNFESRHNLKYWSGQDYLGFGLSATSTIGNKRFTNAKTFEGYFNGEREVEILGNREKIEEKIMLGLRCRLGFNIEEIKTLGYDISSNKSFQEFIKKDILKIQNKNVFLSSKYYIVNNQIISSLLP